MATPPVVDQNSDSEHSERRRFSRIPFDADTSLSQGNQHWPCQLLDISLKGLLINEPVFNEQKPYSLDDSQPVDITIKLTDDLQIQLLAELSWRNEGQMGFTILRLDTDSISHLRRLIELNLGDSEAADRELLSLITTN